MSDKDVCPYKTAEGISTIPEDVMENRDSDQFILPQMGDGTMLCLPDDKFTERNIQNVFQACIENGLCFFDTAEMYGNGSSEKIPGRCIKNTNTETFIADKFSPPSKMNPLKALYDAGISMNDVNRSRSLKYHGSSFSVLFVHTELQL